MKNWISQSEAARQTGVSQQYISRLIKMGIPTNSKRQVRIVDVRGKLKAKGENGKDDDGNNYWKEKARHEKLKACLAEIEPTYMEGNGEGNPIRFLINEALYHLTLCFIGKKFEDVVEDYIAEDKFNSYLREFLGMDLDEITAILNPQTIPAPSKKKRRGI